MDAGHIVLFGGSGFIGQPLIAELVQAGHDVTVVSRHNEHGCAKLYEQLSAQLRRPGDRNAAGVALGVIPFANAECGELTRRALANRAQRTIVVNLGRPSCRNDGVSGSRWTAVVFALVRGLADSGLYVRLLNIGSITEYSRWRLRDRYTVMKRALRASIFASGVCDFHVVFGLVYPGNPRMLRDLATMRAAVDEHPTLATSFRIACIRLDHLVAQLAGWCLRLVDGRVDGCGGRPTVELVVLDEDLSLGELMVRMGVLDQLPAYAGPSCDAFQLIDHARRYERHGRPYDLRLARFYRLAATATLPALHSHYNHYMTFSDAGGRSTEGQPFAREPKSQRALSQLKTRWVLR